MHLNKINKLSVFYILCVFSLLYDIYFVSTYTDQSFIVVRRSYDLKSTVRSTTLMSTTLRSSILRSTALRSVT